MLTSRLIKKLEVSAPACTELTHEFQLQEYQMGGSPIIPVVLYKSQVSCKLL